MFNAAKKRAELARFLASPVGAATTARRAGHRFFEVQLPVRGHQGIAGSGTPSSDVLGDIEKVGWQLEHASYLLNGFNGATIGVYLFRSTGQ